jgi:hypothetical protein
LRQPAERWRQLSRKSPEAPEFALAHDEDNNGAFLSNNQKELKISPTDLVTYFYHSHSLLSQLKRIRKIQLIE